MNKKYIVILLVALVAYSCRPEAKWTDKKIEIDMSFNIVSSAFIQCSFSTNRETYYLISIQEAREDYDPMKQQKQFMTLAIDSANLEYLKWRNKLLKEGEFNIAPFSSHALKYGTVEHTFTGLYSNTDYWVFAFAVNPETLEPIGHLYLTTVRTTEKSIMDVHFEYRVRNDWDYIYPIDSNGNILSSFPYVATTRDSLETLADTTLTPIEQFVFLLANQFINPQNAKIYYGVQAIENDGIKSYLCFEEGHTYYTAIGGFDGNFRQVALYKFKWLGEKTDLYFHDTDSTNLAKMVEDPWWEDFDF